MLLRSIILLQLAFIALIPIVNAQNGYLDSMKAYRKNYIATHEVVTGNNTARFDFYPINEKWNIKAQFSKIDNAPWVAVTTSKGTTKNYRKYGSIHFEINDTSYTLFLYQAEQLINKPGFENYLFLPFMDNTTGVTTYGSGRYLELEKSNIGIDNSIDIDFNKTFNPYCAYGLGVYNCPITPQENKIKIAVTAGEKNFLAQKK